MGGDSLNIAAGALAVYQSQIAVISNNIANVGTTAFKSQTLLLQDNFYNPIKSATAPTAKSGGVDPLQTGDGVMVARNITNLGQGSFTTTGVATNLAIDGDGYFVVNNVDGSGQPRYTRDGSFTLNQDGILVNGGNGLAVQGYQAAANGTISPNGAVQSLRIPLGLATEAIGTGFGAKVGPSNQDAVFDMKQGGNLNQSAWVTAANGGAAVAQKTTTTLYDSLGGSHEVTLTFTPDAAVALPASVPSTDGTAVVPATRWKVDASFTDGTQISGAAAATVGYVFFDKNGQYINSSSSAAAPAAGNTHVTGNTPAIVEGNIMDITAWGTNNNATASTASVGAIALSFAQMTSLAGGGQPVTTVNQNGYAQGQLTTIQVGGDGVVTGSFTNGLQKTLAQVTVATFANPQGLLSTGANMFQESADSGLAQIGTAGVAQAGTITANQLEQSNVSLATEFAKLIVAQNSYIANSKSITVGQQDLQTINNLIN